MDLNLFIPITKIDVAKRLVVGTIAEEIPDLADEIMDYETAKPMFEAWSAEIAKASNGKSVGNLRAMHGSIAAGKLDQIHFDDDARRIATVAKIVDDAEWKKVLEGVYTGFSMGGRYLDRWPDPEQPGLTRYTPEPMEVSLVDHPCIPSATFEVVKADGSTELRKFKSSAAERDVSRDALEFADPGYQKDRKKRYPLDTEAHIRAAWGYIHHAKNLKPYTADQVARIKARIVAAWKLKIDKDGPPLAAGKSAPALRLRKDLGDVSQLALIIDDLSQIAGELDGNTPLKANVENLIALLHSLVEEATSGISDSNSDDASAPGSDSDADDGAGDQDSDDDASSRAGNDAAQSGDDSGDDYEDGAAEKRARTRHGMVLQKAVATLAPRIAMVSTRLDDLTKRLEHLESQPLPGGPVTKFVTVTKAQDLSGQRSAASFDDPFVSFQQHLESLPAGERAHLLTKLSLRNPVSQR
jgi:hypothetical protein